MTNPQVKRVLVSVTDKTGVVEFARALHEEFGAEIISTGGTAKVIAEAGVDVTPIDAVTNFPEMMDGRVKTLHPMVHGGLLAKRDNAKHMAEAEEHGIKMIDMVVVNLYAFEKTVASGADFGTCIENIDIGGPSMLRSAAKNFESVAVVTEPSTYDAILEEMRANDGATTRETRAKLALRCSKLRMLTTARLPLGWTSSSTARPISARRLPTLSTFISRSSRTCAMAKTRIRAPRSTACPMPTRIAS